MARAPDHALCNEIGSQQSERRYFSLEHVGYVAGASLKGIKLDSLEIRTRGTLDLRGFLGLDDSVPPGYQSIDYDVRIKGDGFPEQFEEIHQAVMKTSPNYFNISRPVRMNGTLHVG